MEFPFSNLEVAFILIAFTVFSIFSLASIYSEPEQAKTEDHHSIPKDSISGTRSKKKHRNSSASVGIVEATEVCEISQKEISFPNACCSELI
ncbi:hypothetical protein XELAEV_18009183mg [Xenopus laevis]|uniref:Small integral membrane protein 31 n=1 Tax=Xenopus laevis TaxID=8355 RepID=A0A974I0C1_XENLA|nr:hypothetical protein XELAEV_18009183mg [Xenopus laevis]